MVVTRIVDVRGQGPSRATPLASVEADPGDQLQPASSPLGVPEWASAWGVDEFGAWVEFQFEEATQRMRWVPPATFWMGSPESELGRLSDELLHSVVLTNGYWLGDTACTQELWEAVMGGNPSRFAGPGHDRRPVETVSWTDCHEFLARLNKEVPQLDVRLPTEAEWENACRAGTRTPFSFGADIAPTMANYDGTTPYMGTVNGVNRGQTVPVQSLAPNPLGFYEMHGNVWEWCLDEYGSYQTEYATDPLGQSKEDAVQYSARGGSWHTAARGARCASRSRYEPTMRDSTIGFRLAGGGPIRVT